MKLLIMQSPSVHCYRIRLSLNILSTPSEAEKHKHWYIKYMNIRSCDNTENTPQLLYDIIQFMSVIQWRERVRFPNRVEMYKQPAPVRAVQVLPSSYLGALSNLGRSNTFFVPDSSYTLAFTCIITSYITQNRFFFDTGFSWFPCVYKQMLRWFPW